MGRQLSFHRAFSRLGITTTKSNIDVGNLTNSNFIHGAMPRFMNSYTRIFARNMSFGVIGEVCSGCGARFQQSSPWKPGFLPPVAIKQSLSEREIEEIRAKPVLDLADIKLLTKSKQTRVICAKCHGLKHQQGAPRSISKKTNLVQFEKLNSQKGGYVVLIVDLLDLPGTLIDLEQYCGLKKTLVVLNKIDLMPIGYEIHKVKSWIKTKVDAEVVEISGKSLLGIEFVLEFIKTAFLNKQDCYLVGCTNVGKSTILNGIKKMAGNDDFVTVSPTCGTTSGLLSTPASKLTRLFKGTDLEDEPSIMNLNLIDTAGIVSDNQLCNLFTFKELTYFWPTKPMIQRKFTRKQGHSLFLGGFIRVDITDSVGDIVLHLFSSRKLPVHLCRTSKCDDLISDIGENDKLYPPLKRKIPFPKLQVVGKFNYDQDHERMFIISGAGWFTIAGKCSFIIHSPNGVGIHQIKSKFINSNLLKDD